MKKIFFLLLLIYFSNTYAQEKKLWAKSFINKKAPELVVEEWLSEKPNTKGKFILIDFWATWCRPCKMLIPELNQFHSKFKDQLVIIGISDQTKNKVLEMIKPKINYYQAIDTNAKLKRIYQVRGIPHCVIINPEGIVVWEGFPKLKGFELTEKKIIEILKNK